MRTVDLQLSELVKCHHHLQVRPKLAHRSVADPILHLTLREQAR